MNKVVAVSGYFVILHIGHIEYLREAKKLGNKLVVILNNDDQQFLKYAKTIVPLEERAEVLKSIKYVDQVIRSIDQDRTVRKTLELLKPDIFANGGDRDNSEIPEAEICEKHNIQMVDGLGTKIQSSSWLLQKL
jgi:cytidyltransferase-like protein